MPRSLVQAHRILAAGLGLFIVSHLAIHLFALGGAGAHQAALSSIQGVYRNRFVEPVLLVAFALQILIGVRLLARRWRETDKGFWGWAQILSGAFLVIFILAHSSAALSTRHMFKLDTDFYWVAATLTLAPFKYTFAPYYTLAVLSVFTHLAAAVRFGWPGAPKFLPASMIGAGLVMAALILPAFSGALYAIDLPPENAAYFEKFGF